MAGDLGDKIWWWIREPIPVSKTPPSATLWWTKPRTRSRWCIQITPTTEARVHIKCSTGSSITDRCILTMALLKTTILTTVRSQMWVAHPQAQALSISIIISLAKAIMGAINYFPSPRWWVGQIWWATKEVTNKLTLNWAWCRVILSKTAHFRVSQATCLVEMSLLSTWVIIATWWGAQASLSKWAGTWAMTSLKIGRTIRTRITTTMETRIWETQQASSCIHRSLPPCLCTVSN